jgi:hypothetical protein
MTGVSNDIIITHMLLMLIVNMVYLLVVDRYCV